MRKQVVNQFVEPEVDQVVSAVFDQFTLSGLTREQRQAAYERVGRLLSEIPVATARDVTVIDYDPRDHDDFLR